MGEILSLKLHRKRKARVAKETNATANRAKFGRAKDERELTESRRDQAEKQLDGHKLKE